MTVLPVNLVSSSSLLEVGLKPKILWVTDGVGWGWDIRARAIARYTRRFVHKVTNCHEKSPEMFACEVHEENPAIIVIFAPVRVEWVPEAYHSCTIVCLPGSRIFMTQKEIKEQCQLNTK